MRSKWKDKSSYKVIKTAIDKYAPKMAVAWTGGKDSTVVLHMVREINKGNVPIPILFIDTGLHFEETYDFVKKMKKEWKLDIVTVKDKSLMRVYKKTKSKIKRKELARKIKINALKTSVRKNKWKALMVGIRWDEHQARSSEVYFSNRKDHMRVHPILHFTEQDVWDYIHHYNLPYNPLYDQGYRSIGEKEFTRPVYGQGKKERSGREKDKEQIMARLRALGYF